ncbi:MAG: Mur ligase family protein [Patescibacteria group bacterium]|nr:Mur ligase family protein [Patescibacteria group bacterium]
MKNQKYLNSIKFLESLTNIPELKNLKKGEAKDLSFFIKRLEFLLKILGNPEKEFKYIHIAGTSGKSSLACFIQSVMSEAGIKTGGFFSPHLASITERIKMNNREISPGDLARLIDRLKPYYAVCAKSNPYGVPSYFETLITIALLYFKEKKCEYVVLETGIGSSFDATNIIPRAKALVITNIGVDHDRILGKTKIKIAKTKAKIIKNGSILLTGEEDPLLLKILEKNCEEKRSELKKINFNFRVVKNGLTGTEFEYKNNNYRTKIAGEHQIKNAILAIETINSIKDGRIGPKAIKKGLAAAWLPGRLEIIQRKPLIILDGAHNPDKMKTTADFVKNLEYKKLYLVIGLAESKNLYNTLKYIIPLGSQIYLTRFLFPGRKSKNLRKMSESAEKLTKKKIKIFVDPWQALEEALAKAKKDDAILITGSFFLAGELRKKWIKSRAL